MVAGALWYMSLFGPLTLHTEIATTLGVFISMLLGCGLFAAAFFSSKSGYDQNVTDATRGDHLDTNPTKIGRAHVRTQGPNAHLVLRLLLDTNTNKELKNTLIRSP